VTRSARNVFVLAVERKPGALVLSDREGCRGKAVYPMTCGALDSRARQRRHAVMHVGMAHRACLEWRFGLGHAAPVARLATRSAMLSQQWVAGGGMVEVAAVNHVKPPCDVAGTALCRELPPMRVGVTGRTFRERKRLEAGDALAVGTDRNIQ
jgi:hypothetical protein